MSHFDPEAVNNRSLLGGGLGGNDGNKLEAFLQLLHKALHKLNDKDVSAIHKFADTNKGLNSIHHTLGWGGGNAAPGGATLSHIKRIDVNVDRFYQIERVRADTELSNKFRIVSPPVAVCNVKFIRPVDGRIIYVYVANDGGGFNWNGEIKWDGGLAPDFTVINNCHLILRYDEIAGKWLEAARRVDLA